MSRISPGPAYTIPLYTWISLAPASSFSWADSGGINAPHADNIEVSLAFFVEIADYLPCCVPLPGHR
jgi:hypothetical protein